MESLVHQQESNSSRYKIGGNLARSLQIFIFTPLDDLETQIILETIFWPAILSQEMTILTDGMLCFLGWPLIIFFMGIK